MTILIKQLVYEVNLNSKNNSDFKFEFKKMQKKEN